MIYTYNILKKKVFLINKDAYFNDPHKAALDLFSEFFNFLLTEVKANEIFVHNLGGFDGYFIYKYATIFYDAYVLSVKPEEGTSNEQYSLTGGQVDCIIDDQSRFILIKVLNTKFIDSFRIFPVSLNELCEVFNKGEGKASEYNQKFNSINILNNAELYQEFINYAITDSIVLYKCMFYASLTYKEEYDVELSNIVSISSLSLLIYRKKFMPQDIPYLYPSQDLFIRESYHGGSTDFYQRHAQNLYCYDVNSLYPYVMLKEMPFKATRSLYGKEIDLNTFFGFVLVKVIAPKDLLRPVLIHQHEGRTIHPVGEWYGVYFSVEIKAAMAFGYKFEPVKGIEFTKAILFSDYVKHFYQIKKDNDGGPLRFISKLHLNSLYGTFGRSKTTTTTLLVDSNTLSVLVDHKVVRNIVPLAEDKILVIVENGYTRDVLESSGLDIENRFKGFTYPVKSNVAIASAITAYARIHMMQFKKDDGICYTDTDSVYTTSKLPDLLVGKELGLMKDEMKGLLIDEAIFIGIKFYGYKYTDSNGLIKEQSVYPGVPRNSITFKDLLSISQGEVQIKHFDPRFSKNLGTLNVKVDNAPFTTLVNRNTKQLVGNTYYSELLYDVNHPLAKSTQSLKNKVINNIKVKIFKWSNYFKNSHIDK